MIFKSLTIHNFGIYAGTNTINLSMKSNRPVILIGGLNGRGKTTLLEAILLVLYGKQSYAVKDSKLPYSEYLKKYISTANSAHDAFIELTVQIDANQPDLVLRRTWSDFDETIEDQFTVFQSGKPDPYMADNWYLYMDNVLPTGVSTLFFFDGEKIMELANDETDSSLKKSIQSLMGIDSVERLIHDLQRIIDKPQYTKNDTESGLDDLRSKAVENRRQITSVIIEIDELSKQENALKEEIEEIREQLVNSKNDAAMLEADAQQKDQIKHIQNEITEKLSEYMPLALVNNLLSELLKDIKQDNENYEKSISAPYINHFKATLLDYVKNKGIDSNHSLLLEAFINEYSIDVKEYGDFHTSRGTHRIIQNLHNYQLQDLDRDICDLIEKRDLIKFENMRLRSFLRAGNETDSNESLVAKFEQLTEQRQLLREKSKRLNEMKKELEKTGRQLKFELRTMQQQVLEKERSTIREARTLKYANYSIEVMERFKLRLQEMKVVELTQKINDCFQRLIGKKDLLNHIYIDPKTLDITLLDQAGNGFSKTKLSAGERQMLAIALLWGLSMSMSSKLPVFIDTPLARLDSKHRESFIGEYLPSAGEQVIVLSTDEEIYGHYFNMLSNYITASYILQYDEKNARTTIESGYFTEK